MRDSNISTADRTFEQGLRPKGLFEFVGNKPVCERLHILIQAAKGRSECLSHILFHGPPGLGKTTLSSLLAKEMDVHLTITSGPALEKAADLAGLLTSLNEHDILFIDEIHRLPKTIEEYLYSAMEDCALDLMIDSGPNARSVRIALKPFTLIGATTKMGLLSSPLLSRFPTTLRLEYYDTESLQKILLRSAVILQTSLDEDAALAIATRSRGTPRMANNLLRWIRDYAQLHHANHIDVEAVEKGCAMIDIDEMGLDPMDKKILSWIIDHYDGGPVGIKSIAQALGEEENTLTEVYEPYLIMKGLLKRTPRGREVTSLAYKTLGFSL